MSMTINLRKMLFKAQKIFAELAIEYDGNIFGGYVRDKLYHDMYANDFYNYVKKSCKNEDYITYKQKCEKYYDDENYHKESIGRLLIAKDIDIFFSSKENYEKFFNIIKTKYRVKCIREVKHEYDFLPSEVKHIKCTVDMCELIRNEITFDIDILYTEVKDENIFPPFDHVDMYCNSLIYNKKGIYVSYGYLGNPHIDGLSDSNKLLFEIELYNNIRNKITTFNYYIFGYYNSQQNNSFTRSLLFSRFMNMIRRGWIVKNKYCKYIKNVEENIEKNCPVCTEDIGTKSYFRLKCCQVHFHKECLESYIIRMLDQDIPKCVHRCEQVEAKNYKFIWCNY